MHKKISIGITASLVLIAITITFTATMILSMNIFSNKVNVQRQAVYDKILEIDKVVSQSFYRDVDEDLLYSRLIAGYLNGLDDPDTVYLTAAQIAQREQQMSGTIITVGLDLMKNESGYFTVTKIYDESPADKIDIAVGDVVTKIDGQDLFLLSNDEARTLVSGGNEGDTIALDYARKSEDDGSTELKTADLLFTRISVKAVEDKKINDVYYIRVISLWRTAPGEFAKALSEADRNYQAGDVNGMVIDLRNVSEGNDLAVAADILKLVMPNGKLISGIYRGEEEKILHTADGSDVAVPFVVLINQNTKGYAEILAAVLMENNLCRDVVGVRTAGHGTYRPLIKFSDGSGLELSVALLKPPKGPTFHEVGVAPISEVRLPDDFIYTGDPNVEEDRQFAKAIEVLQSYAS